MDFMGIGILELFIILILVLMVFGPEKMLQTARMAGQYVRKFRMITAELNRQINAELDKDVSEVKNDIRGIGNDLSSEIRSVSNSLTSKTTLPQESHPQTDHQVENKETGSQAGEADG